MISLSNSLGIARYSLLTNIAKCANICLGSVEKFTGNTIIEFGLMFCFSQFRDSLKATFIKLTAALLAPSTKKKVFQCFLYISKHMSTMSCGLALEYSSADNTLILCSSFKNSVNTISVLLEEKPKSTPTL